VLAQGISINSACESSHWGSSSDRSESERRSLLSAARFQRLRDAEQILSLRADCRPKSLSQQYHPPTSCTVRHRRWEQGLVASARPRLNTSSHHTRLNTRYQICRSSRSERSDQQVLSRRRPRQQRRRSGAVVTAPLTQDVRVGSRHRCEAPPLPLAEPAAEAEGGRRSTARAR
jgi:hypothetical protein